MTSDETGDRRAPGADRAEGAPPSRSRFSAWPAQTQRVGGVSFVASTPRAAARQIVRAALAGGPGEHIHLANAYSVAIADSSRATNENAFSSGGWNLPDGRPIAAVSHLRLDKPVLRQIRGPQLFLDVCAEGLVGEVRHYLLGSTPEVLERLENALAGRFPGIRIVGVDSPPFRKPSETELEVRDAAILESGAHIVWVGLGTPKQDVEAKRIAEALPVIAVAVGAAFDFAAGTSRQAPRWVTAIGLEWVFRLLSEPRRLWRRYLFGNLQFLRALIRA